MDCLKGMRLIDDASIDMVLCDLPYGVTARNKWDVIIPFNLLWEQYTRIIKLNGAMVFTAIQPFSSMMVISNSKLFKYEWIWEKHFGTGFLNAKKAPLRNHESILVFYTKPPIYNPQFTKGKPYKCKQGDVGSNYQSGRDDIETVSDGKRYPLTVQKFKSDKKLHPTQKPVALFEYLIKTYTNEGDLVLDNCAGSGTTAIACINTERNFIGFETEKKYVDTARGRIKQCEKAT